MGLIFNQETAAIYESWCQSPSGRAIDQALKGLLLSQIRPKPGERVLDVGCGSGSHLSALRDIGLDVTGVDASPYMTQLARERLGHRVTLKTGRAEDLPFDDNEFDVVVMVNTIEFLDDPLAALREAGRVGRRRLFIGVLNSLSCSGLGKRIQGYLGNPVFRRARLYNLWELKTMLQAALGDVDLSWSTIHIRPTLFQEPGSDASAAIISEKSPFGSFLGVGATITYRLRAEGLPLTVQIKKRPGSLVSARSFGDSTRQVKGGTAHERSLPL